MRPEAVARKYPLTRALGRAKRESIQLVFLVNSTPPTCVRLYRGSEMHFDLDLEPGKLTRKINDVYHVQGDHPAYEYLKHACLSFETMGIAVSVRKSLPSPSSAHLSLPCKAYACTVVLPASGLVDLALVAEQSDDRPFIEITYEWDSERPRTTWALGIRRWMELTLASGFVQLYEQNKTRIHKRSTKIGALAKVVRNACSHNFNIAINNSEGVEIDGLKITKNDRGKPMWDFLELGDFFVLSMLMFSEPKLDA